MTKMDQIKAAIVELPEADMDLLRDWFAEFDAARFDEKIERDASDGKLDGLMAEAEANYRAGRRREL